MQRWKCAVGAIVMLAVAGGSVAGCSKGGNTKQNAAQAKAKPKTDPKAAAKTNPKAAKADPKTAKADPKAAAKPAQTANAQPAPKPAPATAANTKPAAPAPAPAQTAANTKPAAPAPAANGKPAANGPALSQRSESKGKSVEAAAANVKPAAAAPAPVPAKSAVSEQTGEWQKSLQTNKALSAQVQSRLPAGTDVMKASAGFRNLQQFVSAVHASQNLSIPFDKLRTALVDEQKSLSTAIRALKPTATATIEAQRADYEARGTIFQAQQADTAAPDSAAKKAKSSTK
jgi:hypothetical protein